MIGLYPGPAFDKGQRIRVRADLYSDGNLCIPSGALGTVVDDYYRGRLPEFVPEGSDNGVLANWSMGIDFDEHGPIFGLWPIDYLSELGPLEQLADCAE